MPSAENFDRQFDLEKIRSQTEKKYYPLTTTNLACECTCHRAGSQIKTMFKVIHNIVSLEYSDMSLREMSFSKFSWFPLGYAGRDGNYNIEPAVHVDYIRFYWPYLGAIVIFVNI